MNASIFHPQGLVTDEGGNVYVSSENGYIRKIDPSGRIEMYAGKLVQEGGRFTDTAHAEDMNFSSPYGMVIDKARDIMYVADMGHHRVVAIDMTTKVATTIAGTGQCVITGNIGDNKSALLASLCHPKHLGLDESGNLLIFDSGHNKIRRVSFGSVSGQEIAYAPESNDNSVLKKLGDGTFRLEHRNGKVDFFNNLGNLTQSENRIGHIVTYLYDDEDRLEKVVDPTGGEIVYNYSGSKLSSIIDPAGRETNFEYDDDNLVEVSFPDGSNKRFEYDDLGMMTAEYDQNGSKVQYLYNHWKRLWKVIRPDNSEIIVQDKDSLTVGNNFTGGVTGNLKSLDNEVVDKITDVKGNVTTFNTDENGYVSKITDSKGDIYKVERDIEGRATKITRPDDSIIRMEYDPIFHDLIKKTDTLSNISLDFTYDQWGNIASQTLENGETVNYNYNSTTGLLASKTLPLNSVESYEYYSNGLISAKINSLGHRTSYVYGGNGNLVTVTDSLGHSIQLVRDLSGNILTSTNAKGQTVTYSHDNFNRLTSVKSAKDEVTSYEYLTSGLLAKITDPENNHTTFEYDQLGRLKKKTDPLGHVNELSYDVSDNVISEIDPNRQIKNYEYDHLNRLVKKILPDDIYEISYDERDNLKTIKNSRSLVTYDYFHLEKGDVVTRETTKGLGELSDLPISVINYDYDESGNRIEMATSNGDFSYYYDKLNRLTKITNHKDEIFDFNYDVGGRLIQQRSPSTVTNYDFDNVNYLKEISHKKRTNQNIISLTSYERDSVGNITRQSTTRGDFNFTYDNNNQLINATNPESITSNYSYDALGNRVVDQDGSYVYGNKKQRLEYDWRYTYLYDNNGNLISRIQRNDPTKLTNYEYTSLNQLVVVKEMDGASITKESYYAYDSLGRRVLKEHVDSTDNAKSFTKKYVYDGNNILFELNRENDVLATYTHSLLHLDDVLAMDRNNQSYFYLKDHVGSINEIVDNNGNTIQRYVYSSFGNILKVEDGNSQSIVSHNVENFYTFAGRESDFETGLSFYRARYYDSKIGRFLSADPDIGKANRPITFNSKYVYGNNSPTMNVDPNGKLAFLAVIAIAAVVGGTMSAIQAPGGWDWGAFLSGAAIGVVGGSVGFGFGAVLGPMFATGLAGAIGAGAASSMATYVTMSIVFGNPINLAGLLLSGFIGGLAGGIGFANNKADASSAMKDLADGTKTINDEIILNLDLGPPVRTPHPGGNESFNMDKFLH